MNHDTTWEPGSRMFRTLRKTGCGITIWANFVLMQGVFAQEAPPNPVLVAPELPPTEALSQDVVEVLTRGPVHEAFAEPFVMEPAPGLIISKQPPKEIFETPPDYKPEGDDVVWLSGYWAWDDERDNFVWVSGLWRKLPPGQRWIPGYWRETNGGWQWVPGLWTSIEAGELAYRPVPPESLEAGPNMSAPSDSHFWVPGCWMWYETGYRWRPGYWHPYRENWIWVPEHWTWTPSGCLFVAGYWDYRISNRGQLFAPVYIRDTSRLHTSYYSPTCVVESNPLLFHFWVRPRYSHYYFGDYYGPKYSSWGIKPWCKLSTQPRNWDPLLTHYNVHYRHHEHFDYAARMVQWNSYYTARVDDRPKRTLRDQEQVARAPFHSNPQLIQQSLIGTSLTAAIAQKDRNVTFKPIATDFKQNLIRETNQLRDFGHERSKSESMPRSVRTNSIDERKHLPPPTEANRLPRNDFADRQKHEPPRATDNHFLKLPKAAATFAEKATTNHSNPPPKFATPTPVDRNAASRVSSSPERSRLRDALPQDATPRFNVPPVTQPREPMPKTQTPSPVPNFVKPRATPPVETAKPDIHRTPFRTENPKTPERTEIPRFRPKPEPSRPQPMNDPPRIQNKPEPPRQRFVDPPRRSEPPKRNDEPKSRRDAK